VSAKPIASLPVELLVKKIQAQNHAPQGLGSSPLGGQRTDRKPRESWAIGTLFIPMTALMSTGINHNPLQGLGKTQLIP
jgi:hypothetical protein